MKKAKSVFKMKPLPVRFEADVMDRCKDISMNLSQPCSNASEVARNAMEYGLRAMEDLLSPVSVSDEKGGAHLQSDLLK